MSEIPKTNPTQEKSQPLPEENSRTPVEKATAPFAEKAVRQTEIKKTAHTEEDGVPVIEVKGVSKLYGMNRSEAVRMMKNGKEKDEVNEKTGVTVALWDVDLTIKEREIFAIIGLSGSGKSTIIRCLNMLLRPTSGQVLYKGTDVSKLSKKELLTFRREKMSMVFQSFGLMSHRDVLGNVAYGLEVRGMPKEERETRAMEMIEMVGLSGWENETIDTLSGGMRQRVGIARALANDPEVLLMDEPFSALDPLVRSDMQFELLSIQRKLGKTVVFITHDINEAFKLGDTVAIMRDGKVIQVDTPEEMSTHPADDYVRKFIDSADKTKVLSVSHVMVKPSCLMRLKDTPNHAIRLMRRNEVSSAYVVDSHLHFKGVLTIDSAIKARADALPLADMLTTDVLRITADALINDILPLAAKARYPMVVIDDEDRLLGIVSRASVLSSLL